MTSLALIDGSNIWAVFWHAMREDAIAAPRQKTVNYIMSRVAEHDHAAVAIDMPPYKRRERMPEYKAQREPKPKSYHEERRRVYDELRQLGVHVIGCEGYEADDIIATLCCADDFCAHDVVIYSADKDLYQLLGPGVIQISFQTGSTTDVDRLREKWGITPAQVPAFLALTGDKSDNIPGVNKCGPKTAARLLNKHGSIANLLHDVVHHGTQFTPALATNLREAAANLPLWEELTTLDRSVPIDPLSILEPVTPTGSAVFDPEEQHEENAPMEDDDPISYTVEDAPEPPPDVAPPERKSEPRALAVHAPAEWSRQLEPVDWNEAWRAAGLVVAARMFADKFGSREQVCVVIMAGRARGLDLWTSLNGISIVKGKPFFSTALIIGMAQSHKECIYLRPVGEPSAQSATWETMRRGWTEPLRMSYTIEQAQQAGLVARNSPWEARPAEMVLKQSGRILARAAYADIVGGLYAPEEMPAADWEVAS